MWLVFWLEDSNNTYELKSQYEAQENITMTEDGTSKEKTGDMDDMSETDGEPIEKRFGMLDLSADAPNNA